jgi:L-ascorbate metabolism protein UlaG (beta-lactamase superfamily)
LKSALVLVGSLAAAVGCAAILHNEPAGDVESRPAHHMPDGTFVNTDGQAISKSFTDLLRWRWSRTEPSPQHFDVLHPDPDVIANPATTQITWLGHSAFLLQVEGKNILTDPHFSKRASPLSFAGPKRIIAPPLNIDELPHIHAVVISHNHYDHLDEESLTELYERQKNAPPLFLVPLGLKEELLSYDMTNVVEMDWWESHEYEGMTLTALPVKHWSQRTFFDRNKSLWAGWLVDIEGFRFFHTGDSGYSDDFRKIGEDYPGIDLATIPIGAYDPRWFMKDAHMSPEEAVQTFIDLKADKAIGMHWGTFILTDEEMDEPPVRLAEALKEKGIEAGNFSVMDHGEVSIIK